jgi:S-adenosylmethionine hydrolase
VDDFGNVITNVSETDMARLNAEDWLNAEMPNCKLKLIFGKNYGEAEPKEAIALIGSHGYLEIAVNQGSAAEAFHAKPGDRIRLSTATDHR